MINNTVAEKIIRKIYPKAKVNSINLYKKGMINKNYEIITSNPNKEFILRIYPKDGWKAKKENELYSLISKKIDIPIPKVYLIDDNRKIIEYTYLLLSKIDGEELNIAYKRTKNKSLIITAGEILGKIHTIRMPNFGWITDKGVSPSFSKWTEFLEYDLNEKLSKLIKIRSFPKEIISQSKNYFMKTQSLLDVEDEPCLLHKDYHFSHILSDGNGITGIIDLEWAISGINELDITKSIMWMFDKQPEIEGYFLNGYKKMVRLSSSYAKRRNIYEFLILLSSISLAYEYNNLAWIEEYLSKLKVRLSQIE